MGINDARKVLIPHKIVQSIFRSGHLDQDTVETTYGLRRDMLVP